jgi:replicative DNA helicase
MSEGLVPPHDLDAEAVVLSACMLDSDAYDKVQPFLKAEHFYASANQHVFEAISELKRTGTPTDVVAIANNLRNGGKLAKVGGTPYLGSLCDSVPAMANVEQHAKTVTEKAARRLCINVCQRIAAEGYLDNQSLSDWLLDVEARVFDVTRLREAVSHSITIRDATLHELKSMQDRSQNPEVLPGITTGFPSLDRKIGGWRKGAKYTIAARPGQGKSSLMLNFAVSAAEAGHGVVIVSLEMPREQLVQRIIAQIARVRGEDMDRPHRLTSAQWTDITNAVEQITGLPIVIVDASSQTAASVRAAVREGSRLLKQKYNESIEIDLVAIDYIQIMDGDGKGGTRENEVSKISGANRALAKDENCAVLELSQLNRGVENKPDKRPGMADLRESGAIEQDSFGILMIYRDDYYKQPEAVPDGFAEILIRKMRQYGSTGVVKVKFDGPTTNFFEDPNVIQEIQDDFLVDNNNF